MKPLIVVSSKTGNTRVIARALQDGIGPCDYVEAAQMPSDLRAYNPIVLCFWCDRGMAPEDTKAAAERINIPANPHHYWRWRMHLTLEELAEHKDLSSEIRTLIQEAGRE